MIPLEVPGCPTYVRVDEFAQLLLFVTSKKNKFCSHLHSRHSDLPRSISPRKKSNIDNELD